jgi:trehalose 6-phosphate phosphatase
VPGILGNPSRPEPLLLPLLADPPKAAIFCDLDGTLAEIVDRPEQTSIDDRVRVALARIADRYAVTAIISGRRAADARAIVGIQKLTYVGNHGLELLLPDAPEARPAPQLGDRGSQAREFVAGLVPEPLDGVGLRVEDKGPIVALHWRGGSNEAEAEARAEEVAGEAERAGLVIHRGRKVLELRPDAMVDKGLAVESLLAESDADAALYAGDDRTDLDAFRALAEMRASGRLQIAVRIGVRSAEGPAEIVEQSDLTVDGPTGLLPLLVALAG